MFMLHTGVAEEIGESFTSIFPLMVCVGISQKIDC